MTLLQNLVNFFIQHQLKNAIYKDGILLANQLATVPIVHHFRKILIG